MSRIILIHDSQILGSESFRAFWVRVDSESSESSRAKWKWEEKVRIWTKQGTNTRRLFFFFSKNDDGYDEVNRSSQTVELGTDHVTTKKFFFFRRSCLLSRIAFLSFPQEYLNAFNISLPICYCIMERVFLSSIPSPLRIFPDGAVLSKTGRCTPSV